MGIDISGLRHIHFIGVNGIGVSALLRLYHTLGVSVSGSDVHLPLEGILPQGIYFEGHAEDNVPANTDMIVYSPAVPSTNPERIIGVKRGIKTISYPEALGLVTRNFNTIAVSGTHGKSTTTALLGKLFEKGGLDATVIVGAEVPGFNHNILVGESDIFIVEACEYKRNMMNLSPQSIVLTNLELDHPDYYVDLADVKQAFREYIEKLTGEGLLIVNNDDANIRDVIRGFDGIIVRYGVGDTADLSLHNVSSHEHGQTFDLTWKGTNLGTFISPLPGLYNVYNIMAAVATYLAYGGKSEAIAGVLSDFIGAGRRFENLGMLGSTIVISDYAHHPTALLAVVEAAESRYKGKRILTIFRPHHKERTLKLLTHFVDVLSRIPHVILVEIYDVEGREVGTEISSMIVLEKVLEKNQRADIVCASGLKDAEVLARQKAAEFDVILVIGAGDADQLARDLVSK